MQKIAKKFVEVMRECSHVAKNSTNDFHKYKYATATDVLEKVNASLTKHGLASIVTPNLLSMQQVTTATALLTTLSKANANFATSSANPTAGTSNFKLSSSTAPKHTTPTTFTFTISPIRF